jgi:hypothetical protein
MPSHAKSDRCALARANRAFCTDQRRIRTESTVMDKNKNDVTGLIKIVDYARMALFHPCVIDDPRGRPFVRATLHLCNKAARDISRLV